MLEETGTLGGVPRRQPDVVRTGEQQHRLPRSFCSALDEGETFIVTRNGEPVGELTPMRPRRFVAAEAAVAIIQGAPRVSYQRFRADLETAAGQDVLPYG